jgi:hypothetical protein
MQSLSPVSGGSADPVRVYQLQRPIIVDGKYNMTLTRGRGSADGEIWVDEWNQTEIKAMFTLYPESVRRGTGYFACAYDETYLYVMWDFVSCKTKLDTQINRANLCVGASYLNRSRPNNDYDFMFSIEWWGKDLQRFTAFVWSYYSGAWNSGSGFSSGDRKIFFASDLGKSPNSLEQHLVFEAKIPLFYAVRGTSSSLGIRAGLSELNLAKEQIIVSYPNDSSVQVPNQWAELKLMTTAIPELLSVARALTAAMVLLPILLRKRRHTTRIQTNS